jgi:NADH-quinone oxidoreductase subunit J
MLAAFVILAGITLAAAVMVVVSRHVVHSAMYLIVSFLSLAGVFILLGAEFVAAVQIILYAGSIVVLFVFVSMTVGYSKAPVGKLSTGWTAGAVILGVIILAELVFILLSLSPATGAGASGSPVPSPGIKEMGQLIYTDWLLAFEILSLVVLAAMVGIAALRREGRKGQ